MMKEAIILANGTFPTHKVSVNFLKKANFLICCDGAANKLRNIDTKPDLIIGDLDSIDKDLKKKYKNILLHNTSQENNDLSKAIDWCVEHQFDAVKILGATGEREDHTIANIALLTEYQKNIQVQMYTDTGFFSPIKESSDFLSYKGQQVSIFSLNPELEISSKNLKYPLQDLKLSSWWKGTLNESISDRFSISFNGKASVLVYQMY